MSESFFPLLQLCLWMLYVGLWATCWLWSQRGIGPSGSWQCSSPAGGLRSKSECTASQMGPRAKAHKWVSVARCFGLRDRAAWSSPAWPWNPHLFSPACHIGWWFQVALCRKDRRSCGFPWWQPWLWRQVRGCTDLASDSPRTYQLGKHDSEPRWLHSDGVSALSPWCTAIGSPGPRADCDIWYKEKGDGWCELWVSAFPSPWKPCTQLSCTKAECPRDSTPRGPSDHLSQTSLPGAPDCSKDFMDFHWHNCWQLT